MPLDGPTSLLLLTRDRRGLLARSSLVRYPWELLTFEQNIFVVLFSFCCCCCCWICVHADSIGRTDTGEYTNIYIYTIYTIYIYIYIYMSAPIYLSSVKCPQKGYLQNARFVCVCLLIPQFLHLNIFQTNILKWWCPGPAFRGMTAHHYTQALRCQLEGIMEHNSQASGAGTCPWRWHGNTNDVH